MENVSLKFLSEKLYPKVLVLGKEFENTREKDIKESIQFQLKNKCEVQFHAGDINYASADLLKNSESELSLSRKKFFVETEFRAYGPVVAQNWNSDVNLINKFPFTEKEIDEHYRSYKGNNGVESLQNLVKESLRFGIKFKF